MNSVKRETWTSSTNFLPQKIRLKLQIEKSRPAILSQAQQLHLPDSTGTELELNSEFRNPEYQTPFVEGWKQSR